MDNWRRCGSDEYEPLPERAEERLEEVRHTDVTQYERLAESKCARCGGPKPHSERWYCVRCIQVRDKRFDAIKTLFCLPYREHARKLAPNLPPPDRDKVRAMLGVRPWNPIRCLAGDVFGKLTVLSGEGRDRLCRCECGRTRQVQAWRLVHGEVLGCHRCGQIQRLKARGHKAHV